MPAPDTLTSSDTSNILNIMDAAYVIARDSSGVPWGATKEWDLPEEVQTDKQPFLAVTWPQFLNYAESYVNYGKQMVRGIMQIQLVWNIDIYAIVLYDPENPNTYRTPADAMAKLIHAFTIADNLNGTCDQTWVGEPSLMRIEKESGGQIWFATQVPIQVLETLNTVK